MGNAIMNLERTELDSFCDNLPDPIIARPILTATRGRGLTVALKYPGALITLTEGGKPFRFCSVDDVMVELEGTPNLDTSRLIIKTESWGDFFHSGAPT